MVSEAPLRSIYPSSNGLRSSRPALYTILMGSGPQSANQALCPGRASNCVEDRPMMKLLPGSKKMDLIGKEQVSQVTAFTSLSRYCRIAGKRVLELGGNSDCVAATPFAQHGASQVVVTGLRHVDRNQSPTHPLITLERADALRLSESYNEASFDLVYGISILEHIPNPRRLLSEISHILSKGGMAFLQGAPLWSGPWGHHIHLFPWDQNYLITGCYQFLPSEALLSRGINVINPIPDWGHLLYTPDEMGAILDQSNIPANDLEYILRSVYESDDINRETARSICQAIGDSNLKVIELEYDRVRMPNETLETLRDIQSTEEDFSIMGIRTVLLKT